MRKQAREPDKGNPPPGHRLPVLSYTKIKSEVVVMPHVTSSLVLHSIDIGLRGPGRVPRFSPLEFAPFLALNYLII